MACLLVPSGWCVYLYQAFLFNNWWELAEFLAWCHSKGRKSYCEMGSDRQLIPRRPGYYANLCPKIMYYAPRDPLAALPGYVLEDGLT